MNLLELFRDAWDEARLAYYRRAMKERLHGNHPDLPGVIRDIIAIQQARHRRKLHLNK